VATRIAFEPASEGEEAGLTVWMNPSHHYDLFITRQDGQRVVAVRRRIGSLVAEVARVPAKAGALTLTIQGEPHAYAFGVAGSGERQALATGETRYLAPEVAGGFTGVYFALYASGSGSAASTPAFFEWFDYRQAGEPDR